MKNKKWHKIFNKKNFFYVSESNFNKNNKNFIDISYLLTKIIHPQLNKKKYLGIVNFIKKNLKIKKGSSMLDFGSGNGGILYFFQKKFDLNNNYSFEISSPLLKLQKSIIKKTFFFKTHQTNTKFLNSFKNNVVDNSISISVFQYFYNEEYCFKILDFLLRITKKNIMIYDVKNSKTKHLYNKEVRTRQNLTVNEFNKKYKNTPIRFYDKLYFRKILKKLKKKYDFSFAFKKLPNVATDYKFGYCLIISKKNYINS